MLTSKCIVKNQLPCHTTSRRYENLMFSHDEHSLWIQGLPHPMCEYEWMGCLEEKLSLCYTL